MAYFPALHPAAYFPALDSLPKANFPRLATGRITFPRLTTCCAWQPLHVSPRSGDIHVFASGSLSYCGLFASFEMSDVITLFLDSNAKRNIFSCYFHLDTS